jgi:pimeloyl-ACP methyl ester carboxylesterase
VLVHGLMISSLYMIPLAECLAGYGEVHAVDLPGFGRSEGPRHAPSIPKLAEALVDWLAASDIAECHLIANSMGCQVCADLAARFPERVASLTLTGPTIDPAAHSVPRQALRLVGELLREPPRQLQRQTLPLIMPPVKACPNVLLCCHAGADPGSLTRKRRNAAFFITSSFLCHAAER